MTHNPEVDLLKDRRRRDSISTGLEGNGCRSPVGRKPSRSYSLRAGMLWSATHKITSRA
jgi:hypothetical protein